MEKIAYRNKFGDTIYENVERFHISGTIMSAHCDRIGDNDIHHRLYVEDSLGGYYVTVWNNVKGYDRKKLKIGENIEIKGIIITNHYDSEDGVKELKEYKVQEIL